MKHLLIIFATCSLIVLPHAPSTAQEAPPEAEKHDAATDQSKDDPSGENEAAQAFSLIPKWKAEETYAVIVLMYEDWQSPENHYEIRWFGNLALEYEILIVDEESEEVLSYEVKVCHALQATIIEHRNEDSAPSYYKSGFDGLCVKFEREALDEEWKPIIIERGELDETLDEDRANAWMTSFLSLPNFDLPSVAKVSGDTWARSSEYLKAFMLEARYTMPQASVGDGPESVAIEFQCEASLGDPTQQEAEGENGEERAYVPVAANISASGSATLQFERENKGTTKYEMEWSEKLVFDLESEMVAAQSVEYTGKVLLDAEGEESVSNLEARRTVAIQLGEVKDMIASLELESSFKEREDDDEE